MSSVSTGRPVQPSIAKQIAQLMALMDPRCGFEAHNRVAQGERCPHCHLDLFTYIAAVPKEWPT